MSKVPSSVQQSLPLPKSSAGRRSFVNKEMTLQPEYVMESGIMQDIHSGRINFSSSSASNGTLRKSSQTIETLVLSENGSRDIFSWENHVGRKVRVIGGPSGTLKFYGPTHFATGMWCGIELDTAEGKNDGSYMGVRYFSSKSGFGIFAPPHRITLFRSEGKNTFVTEHESENESARLNTTFIINPDAETSIEEMLSDDEVVAAIEAKPSSEMLKIKDSTILSPIMEMDNSSEHVEVSLNISDLKNENSYLNPSLTSDFNMHSIDHVLESLRHIDPNIYNQFINSLNSAPVEYRKKPFKNEIISHSFPKVDNVPNAALLTAAVKKIETENRSSPVEADGKSEWHFSENNKIEDKDISSRLARIIDGKLYYVNIRLSTAPEKHSTPELSLQGAVVMSGSRKTDLLNLVTESRASSLLDSSGIYSDLDHHTVTAKEEEVSSSSTNTDITLSLNVQPVLSTEVACEESPAVHPDENTAKHLELNKPCSAEPAASLSAAASKSSKVKIKLEKYEMPRKNVESRLKAMLASKPDSKDAVFKRPKTPRKGRWDDVMNKIEQNKAEEKNKVKKEVKSKVFDDINLTPLRNHVPFQKSIGKRKTSLSNKRIHSPMSPTNTEVSKKTSASDLSQTVSLMSRLTNVDAQKQITALKSTKGQITQISKQDIKIRVITDSNKANKTKSTSLQRPSYILEIKRLERLCELRTKQKKELLFQLQHCILGFDAMGALVQYMVSELNAFDCPELRQQNLALQQERRLLLQRLDNFRHEVKRLLRSHQDEVQASIELKNREIVRLKQQHEEILAKVREDHEFEMNNLRSHISKEFDMRLQKETATFADQQELAEAQAEALRRNCRQLEDAMRRDANSRLSAMIASRNHALSEVESFRSLLFLRSQDLSEERLQNERLISKLEDFDRLQRENQQQRAKLEDLNALIARKCDQEKQLRTDFQKLKRAYQREYRNKVRLSMEKEALQYRLRLSAGEDSDELRKHMRSVLGSFKFYCLEQSGEQDLSTSQSTASSSSPGKSIKSCAPYLRESSISWVVELSSGEYDSNVNCDIQQEIQ